MSISVLPSRAESNIRYSLRGVVDGVETGLAREKLSNQATRNYQLPQPLA